MPSSGTSGSIRVREPATRWEWTRTRIRGCTWVQWWTPGMTSSIGTAGRLPAKRPHDRRVQHRLGELAGEGVLLRGVEAADEAVGADRRLRRVAEARPRARDLLAELRQRSQGSIPREGAEGEDRLRSL